jgi:hypothetical protein
LRQALREIEFGRAANKGIFLHTHPAWHQADDMCNHLQNVLSLVALLHSDQRVLGAESILARLPLLSAAWQLSVQVKP